MDIVKSDSDLEDGEIRDRQQLLEDVSDVSDCSLSDIIHEDFSDDLKVNPLRDEAVKSEPLQVDEPNNEEEKCRLEALKSLLENTGFMNINEETLQDLTEEEKLRVGAVKSLLRNINFLTTNKPPTPTPVVNGTTKKRKRRKKPKKVASPQKRAKVKEEPVEETKPDKVYLEETKPDKVYLEETTSLLSGLSEDVKKINESIENDKIVKNTETNLVNEDISAEDDSVDEFPTVIHTVRSWYPKTEFTMIDTSTKQNAVKKRDSFNGSSREVKNQSNNSSSQKAGIESATNSPRKTEAVSERSESINTEVLPKPNGLPKTEPRDEITESVKAEPRDTFEQSTEPKIEENSANKPAFNQSTRPNCDFQVKPKPKKTTHQIINSRVIISPKSKPLPAKINSACSFRKFNSTQPVPNKTYSMPRKSNRYKLNNVPASKYTLKKADLKIDNTKFEQNKPTNSRYSINRTNQYSKVNLNEFIIPLDDDDRDDSSREEDLLPEPSIIPTKSEPQIELPSSVKNEVPNEPPEPPKIKEEPQEVPEELPNDDFASTESPSTTTADPSILVKEEPVILVKEEPIPDVFNEPFDVADIEILDVSSLKCDTSPSLPPQEIAPPFKEEPEAKSEVALLFEAEENLVEIRSKLLSSMVELDTSIKTNAQEKETLLAMIKKLNSLKALVAKFEEKIKTQKMKLTMSTSFTQSLYEGVMLRSKTCEKNEGFVCHGWEENRRSFVQATEDFVVELEEKQKTLDFSKYVPKPAEKK